MLALAVAIFISIDVIILVIYTIVDLVSGKFNAILKSNEENLMSHFGVSKKLVVYSVNPIELVNHGRNSTHTAC